MNNIVVGIEYPQKWTEKAKDSIDFFCVGEYCGGKEQTLEIFLHFGEESLKNSFFLRILRYY